MIYCVYEAQVHHIPDTTFQVCTWKIITIPAETRVVTARPAKRSKESNNGVFFKVIATSLPTKTPGCHPCVPHLPGISHLPFPMSSGPGANLLASYSILLRLTSLMRIPVAFFGRISLLQMLVDWDIMLATWFEETVRFQDNLN